MDISINTPALLFPAISLVMLAYTNRFLALANVVRTLHERYSTRTDQEKPLIHAQLKNLKRRLVLIRRMQILGVSSILLAILCMAFIYEEWMPGAHYSFAASLMLFAASLIYSLMELFQSTKSLEIELSDMKNLEDPDLVDMIREKLKV